MKPLLGYYGGKAGPVGAWIAAQLPPHRVYVEPFGGMGGILMQKRPSPVEVYNDRAEELVNLFRVVREQPAELREQLALTPYSRAEILVCRRTRNEEAASPLERARRCYVALAQSRQSDFKASWSHGGPKYTGAVADAFVSGQARIPQVCERLRNVQLDCQTWQRIVEQWDSPHVLIYLDPPYTVGERTATRNYAHEMPAGEHELLMAWCLKATGMVLLSGYRNDLYRDELEANGWLRRDFATVAHSSSVGKKKGAEGKANRVESLWLNPAAAVATPQLFQ